MSSAILGRHPHGDWEDHPSVRSFRRTSAYICPRHADAGLWIGRPRQDFRIRFTAILDIKYGTQVNKNSELAGAEGSEMDWFV
jgi:hypothetical protein